MVTISAVRPPARFGALKLKESEVLSFKEKSQLKESWINGGFFVIEPSFFEFLSGDETEPYIAMSGSFPNKSKYVYISDVALTPDYLDANGNVQD